MELKEAFDTLRPTLIALNAVSLKLEEIDDLNKQVAEAKKIIAQGVEARQNVLRLQDEAQKVAAQKVAAQRDMERLLAESKAESKRLIDDASAEAQRIIDRKVGEAQDRLGTIELQIDLANGNLNKLRRDTEDALKRYNEVEAGIRTLKASL